MKRTILAIAAAGISLSALAAPPADKSAAVTVVNTGANPVPVAITPGVLPTLGIVGNGSLIVFRNSAGFFSRTCFTIDAPMRITQFGFASASGAPFVISWKLSLRPINGTDEQAIQVAFGQLESKQLSAQFFRALTTLPLNVVTPGYDKLCIDGVAGTESDPVTFTFSASGELL